MRCLSTSLLFVSIVSILAGCSDSGKSNKSSLVSIEGVVGAQGFSNAQVVVNQIAESGQVALTENGIYSGERESTDRRSRFTAKVSPDETLLFIARGQIENVDKDKNNLASSRLCQVADGCDVHDADTGLSTAYAFGDYYPETQGFEWRAVTYTVNKGSHNSVNPITTLAAGFAYQYDVLNFANSDIGEGAVNTTFTPYDVLLANSQISELFGITDIIGDTPANLSQLNRLNDNTAEVRNQVRYGALIAAIQKKELETRSQKMPGDRAYVAQLAEEFSLDFGQMYYWMDGSAIEPRTLTLFDLYTAAYQNLEARLPTIANEQAKQAAKQVIAKLKTDASLAKAQPVNTKTQAQPDDISLLLTASEKEEFDLGLEKTKLFVKSLVDYHAHFWQPGYKTELDAYISLLTSIRDNHQANMNEVIEEFKHIQDYYVTCIIGGNQCAANYADLEARKVSYSATSKVLVLNNGNGGQITVSQKVADLNLLDDNDSPSSSHAIDVFITGSIEKNGLVLKLAHKFATITADDSESEAAQSTQTIEVPSAMRLYYSQVVSKIEPSLEIEGYELIWGDFELFDKNAIGSAEETEVSGSFRIFYRGVTDPQNPHNSERRFNIEDWVLTSTISDRVDDTTGTDRNKSTVVITGASSNPDGYYPDKKFASFNGFFEQNTSEVAADTISGLLSYQQGSEVIVLGKRNITVKTVDFINALGQDIRYRFYPDERIEDKLDTNNNGRFDDLVDIHRIEECALTESGAIDSCGPKTTVYEKRNVQNTINDLWKLGLFQRVNVSGRGSYFVEFPTLTDSNGCQVLQPLTSNQTFNATLVEPQVLGLDTLRLYTEVNLYNAQQSRLPNTLVDISIVAPSEDKYQVSAALSHNYSSSNTDNTGLILGSGSAASVMAISYDTSSDFTDMGNITVSKSGVTLTDKLAGVVEDQDMTGFLTQSYDPSSVHYKIIEDEKGQPERCVLSNTGSYEKDPLHPDAKKILYLNYRGVVYATAREEGNNKVLTIRYLDGSWFIPSDNVSSN